MKKPLFVAAIVLGVLAVAGLRVVSAQEEITARMPFSFYVDGHLMPPGNYWVNLPAAIESRVIEIVSQDGRSVAFTLYEGTGQDANPAKPSFQFKKVGDSYVLWRVSAPDLDVVELPMKLPKGLEPALARATTVSIPEQRAGN